MEFLKPSEPDAKPDYAKAMAELDTARKNHLKGRLLRIGKQQNPESDPTEAIFLKCIDEVKTYWALQEKYKSPDLDKLLANAGKGVPKELLDKLIEMKVIAKEEEFADGVNRLLKAREDLAKKLEAKDADKYDAAITAFLKKDGGYDQLAKESALLLDVAKTLDIEKDKLDDVKPAVTELVADGALVKKVGEKLKTDKIIDKFENVRMWSSAWTNCWPTKRPMARRSSSWGTC